MEHLLLSLHVLFAIFAIGPLVGAASTAGRGIRAGDGAAVATAARTVRIYGYLSLLVALLGMSLVRPKWDAKFSYLWVWLSVVLYLAALALTLAVLEPSLRRAAGRLAGAAEAGASGTADPSGTAGRSGAAGGEAGRATAAGGVIALLFAVIVFLMVYQPH